MRLLYFCVGNYGTSYDGTWVTKYPAAKVNNNQHTFRCIPCGKTLPYEHHGSDVISHCNSKTHKSLVKTLKETNKFRVF